MLGILFISFFVQLIYIFEQNSKGSNGKYSFHYQIIKFYSFLED